MVAQRLIVRLLLLCCVGVGVAACNQIPPTPVVPSSPTEQPSTLPISSALLTLLKRPLRLPIISPGTLCPTSPEKMVVSSLGIAQGKGPVYATIGTETIKSPATFFYADTQHFAQFGNGIESQGWGGQKVLWFVNPNYRGLVLIRGKQVDGSHEMRFSQLSEHPSLDPRLVLDTTLASNAPWPSLGSYTRLQVPGCYAYQVDGSTFSYAIVFLAIVKN